MKTQDDKNRKGSRIFDAKERRRLRRKNKFARDLQDDRYRQRIKPAKKQEYKRKKIRIEDVENE
jgi:hypothetical protein